MTDILRLFTLEGCTGEFKNAYTDFPNLATELEMKSVKSLTVTGAPWLVYSGDDYRGAFQVYLNGSHADIGKFNNKLRSVRRVEGGLEEPELTFYEGTEYQGRSFAVKCATPKLENFGMEKKIRSLKVTKGAWSLHDADDFEGESIALLCGDNVSDLHPFGWDVRICSLKPITAE